MTDLSAPILVKEIPAQTLHEGASYQFQLKDFIQSPNEASGEVQFFAELADGRSLPQGLICLPNGFVSGMPAKGTEGHYEVMVMAENDSGIPFTTQFALTIKEPIQLADINQHFTELKAKVWEALGEGLPLPDVSDLLNRPITAEDIYYLLQRFATLKIWDVYNLDPPDTPVLLELEGVSKHYNVYDRGCYIIGVPKDLYNEERTMEDALMTAKAMAAEVYKRDWTIEFTGFGKMARACWVELQLLADKYEKSIEVIHFDPTPRDKDLFEVERKADVIFGRKRK